MRGLRNAGGLVCPFLSVLVLSVACSSPSAATDEAGGADARNVDPRGAAAAGAGGSSLTAGAGSTSHAGGAGAEPAGGAFGSEPAGLDALTHFERLAYLRPGAHSHEFSSSDPTGGNDDRSHYLGKLGGETVLLDAIGPGIVTRFWHTDPSLHSHEPGNPEGIYRFYFDGETSPSFEVGSGALWSSQTSPFVPPLTLDIDASSGGADTYFPIGFAKSFVITETAPGYLDYYNLGFVTFSDRTPVATYTGTEDVRRATSVLANAGKNPIAAQAADVTKSGAVDTIPAGTAARLVTIEGPAEIVELRLTVPWKSANAASALADARLRIIWNGAATPSVDAPIAAFFGSGNGVTDQLETLPLGNHPPDGTAEDFYCYFPMPFERSAELSIDNRGSRSLTGIHYRVVHRPFDANFGSVGTFHADYHRDAEPAPGHDYSILDVHGSGHYVGTQLICPGNEHYEGDVRVFVDGMRSPTILGTGTEDYFNGGWYYDRDFSTPLFGGDKSATDGTGLWKSYRFHLSDLIAFNSSLRFGIEHGSENQLGGPYSSIAYYYLNPCPALVDNDELDVGDSSSETDHGYMVTGASTSTALTARFQDAEQTSLTEDGQSMPSASEASFRVRVSPSNQGVRLRRLLDAATANQRAEVDVDGQSAGVWYTPGEAGTYRWKEDDFWIPASQSSSKSQLSIRIRPQSEWTAFHYWVASVEGPERTCP